MRSALSIRIPTIKRAGITAAATAPDDDIENGNTMIKSSSFLSGKKNTTAEVQPLLVPYLATTEAETTSITTTSAGTANRGVASSSTRVYATSIEKSNASAALEADRRETRIVHWLRCIVFTLLLLTMCLVSGGIFVYTRHHEIQRFETVFADSAFQVMESFHDTLEQSMLSLDALSVTITSLAQATNQTFPFVTIPDFEVRGANTRIQSGSHILYYFPLVTDENRVAWEDYAMQHRSHADVAFSRDTYMRQQQDLSLGITPTSPTPLNITNNTQGSNSSSKNTTEPKSPNMTILEDGTAYHPHIWSNGAIDPLGDLPQGQGPYLPGWQRR